MTYIVPNIHNLNQHLLNYSENPAAYKPTCCPHCSHFKLWSHGVYTRKSPDIHARRHPIPRFFCPFCNLTCSSLPEYIPPKRWYHWAVQHVAIQLLASGYSFTKVWYELTQQFSHTPRSSTLWRWWCHLKQQYQHHKLHLASLDSRFGDCCNVKEFWARVLHHFSLSSVMRTFHHLGIGVP